MTEKVGARIWVPQTMLDDAPKLDINGYMLAGLRGELWSQRRNSNPFPDLDWFPWIGRAADAVVRVASTAVDVRGRLRCAGMALRGELTEYDDMEDSW